MTTMTESVGEQSLHEFIERQKKDYQEDLPPAEPEWPPDVQVVHDELRGRLFEEGLEVQAVVEDCGIGDNNVHTRFRQCVGYGIKEYVVANRITLAKLLLKHEAPTIEEVAYAVGYGSPGGFLVTFKRHCGYSPTEYRRQTEE